MLISLKLKLAIHCLKRRIKGNKGEVAFKIDITKAYDRIRWSYLSAVMLRLGFNAKWVRWIMMCVLACALGAVHQGTLYAQSDIS